MLLEIDQKWNSPKVHQQIIVNTKYKYMQSQKKAKL